MSLNRVIPWKPLKITHNYQFYFYFLGSISHHFKVRRVDIWSYWGFSGVRGEIIWVRLLEIKGAKDWNRGTPHKIKKLLIALILKSIYI